MSIIDDIDEANEVGLTEDFDSGNAAIRGARIGKPSRSGKAIEVDLKGTKHWLPVSQINLDESVGLTEGNVGTIVVPKWLADRIEQEKQAGGQAAGQEEQDDIRLGRCVALGESAKALCVRIPGARVEEIWIPKGQIRQSSEVLYDGDRGTLVISHWIAQEKGLLGISEARGSTKEDPDDNLTF